MTDLTELLERSASDIEVGPLPHAQISARVRRARKRRSVLTSLAGAAAVVGVIGVGAVIVPGLDSSSTDDSGPTSTDSATPPVDDPSDPASKKSGPEHRYFASNGGAPARSTLYGAGNVGIRIPDSWGYNEVRCGTPIRNTVIVDVGSIAECGTARPVDVDAVWIDQPSPSFEAADDPWKGARLPMGMEGSRTPTACSQDTMSESRPWTCQRTLTWSSGSFTVSSSRVSREAAEARVDDLARSIQPIGGLVAVPGYETLNLVHSLKEKSSSTAGDETAESTGIDAASEYIQGLSALGLRSLTATKESTLGPGAVVSVFPKPGQMVATDSLINVTVGK